MAVGGFRLDLPEGGTALCLGAHSDDIEIGMAATVLGLAESRPSMNMVWIVFSASGLRATEAKASAEQCLAGFHSKAVQLCEFRDGHFPSQLADLKEPFELLKAEYNPDVIFTHYRLDLHQDHRVISDLTWQTFRDHLILEYEIPKYDGDIGNPNLYSAVSREQLDEKLRIIESCFQSQRQKPWFTADAFSALARIRGIECNAESGFAEAFYSRKAVLRGD